MLASRPLPDEDRVEFSVGRDLVLNPRQTGEPLNFFVYPYAEADGKPITPIERSFAYRDRRPPAAVSRGH